MNSINDRLRDLRNNLGLGQKEFGNKLGLQDSTISMLENGKRNLTDQTIISICTQFNVNEDWLRTGNGSMFNEMTEDEELAYLVGKVLSGENELTKKLVFNLCKLSDDEVALLMKVFKDIDRSDVD